jgi:hypothetical protein
MKRMFLFAIALLAVPTQIAAQVGVFCRTPAGDYPAPETAALGNTCIFRDANDLAHYGRYIRLPDHDNPRSKAGGHDFGVGVFCRTPLGDCDAAQNAVEGTPCICHQYGSAVPGTNFGIGEGSLGAFRRPGLSERRAPGQYSVEPGPSPKGSPSPPTLPPAPSVVRILDTGYERLRELGSEQKGCATPRLRKWRNYVRAICREVHLSLPMRNRPANSRRLRLLIFWSIFVRFTREHLRNSYPHFRRRLKVRTCMEANDLIPCG